MKIKIKLSDKTKEELKGEPGKTPTAEELVELIKPLIPQPKDGKTPTHEELLKLIEPLIPVVEDGKTPTKEELVKLIKPLVPKAKDGKTPTKKELQEIIEPLIPEPVHGQDGSPDNGEQIKDKINSDSSGKKIGTKHLDLPEITQVLEGGLNRTKYVKKSGDTMTGDLIGTSFVPTRNGTISRSGDYISSVALTGGRTLTITRDGSNYITSIADGTRTWTYTRNASNQITSWAIA